MVALSPYTEVGADKLRAVLDGGPVAQFRVTLTGSGRYIIERRTLCLGAHRIEASWFEVGWSANPHHADLLAQSYAQRFQAQNPGWRGVVVGEPRTGRQPVRSYPGLYFEPGRDEPAALTSSELGIEARAK